MSTKRLASPPTPAVDVGGKRRCVDSGVTTISFPGFYLQAAVYGDKGARKQMEDERLVLPSLAALEPSLKPSRDFAVFAIMDGHGGRQSANFVKTALPIEIAKQLKLYMEQQQQQQQQQEGDEQQQQQQQQQQNGGEQQQTQPLKTTLYAAFRKVDSRIATEIPACRDGCTAVFVLILGRQVFIAGLGDSAAFLARKKDDGHYAIPLTETHRPYLLAEKERILRMGGTIEGGRVNGVLELTRSFGDIS
ncbi:protein phosphatase 2C, putative [Eimeria brunetti]|uniref:protein-serine/threonine phosphatase n=1 Tax=Eimeria brunetti TaxID=51314 RepID=U6LWT9_9EIME|nr:protein phosphatase 2C, putative [Eimeria brunetti]